LDSSPHVPPNWQEAKKHPKWREAMLEEMNALDKYDTWELAELPDNKKGCRF
jgi:hypothetical protein